MENSLNNINYKNLSNKIERYILENKNKICNINNLKIPHYSIWHFIWVNPNKNIWNPLNDILNTTLLNLFKNEDYWYFKLISKLSSLYKYTKITEIENSLKNKDFFYISGEIDVDLLLKENKEKIIDFFVFNKIKNNDDKIINIENYIKNFEVNVNSISNEYIIDFFIFCWAWFLKSINNFKVKDLFINTYWEKEINKSIEEFLKLKKLNISILKNKNLEKINNWIKVSDILKTLIYETNIKKIDFIKNELNKELEIKKLFDYTIQNLDYDSINILYLLKNNLDIEKVKNTSLTEIQKFLKHNLTLSEFKEYSWIKMDFEEYFIEYIEDKLELLNNLNKSIEINFNKEKIFIKPTNYCVKQIEIFLKLEKEEYLTEEILNINVEEFDNKVKRFIRDISLLKWNNIEIIWNNDNKVSSLILFHNKLNDIILYNFNKYLKNNYNLNEEEIVRLKENL